ncbi:hypothetical protein [Thiospirillum jenense]|uniref:Uncharacterized protein n=1 Tax=Thiospirillum jenense TaxID=1653858 RepID=A0A839HCP3_9GAMM|nr:hypothetical protein [Thiospirillum jenense]MBB1125186.1 hypothetical protein [Thiospirillum jenense]
MANDCPAPANGIAARRTGADSGATQYTGHATSALFIGAEWQDSPRWQRLAPLLTAPGIAVHFLPRTPGISSTALRQVLNR